MDIREKIKNSIVPLFFTSAHVSLSSSVGIFVLNINTCFVVYMKFLCYFLALLEPLASVYELRRFTNTFNCLSLVACRKCELEGGFYTNRTKLSTIY
jgi:hypothetical protein